MKPSMQKPKHPDQLPEFWKVYYPYIWVKMQRAIGSFQLSEQDQDDVVQNAIYKLYKQPLRLEVWTDSYCITTAINEAKRWFKRSQRSKTVTQKLQLENGYDENLVWVNLNRQELELAKKSLSSAHYQVLDLAQKGFDRVAIADALELTENQVKGRLQRARCMLKTFLKV